MFLRYFYLLSHYQWTNIILAFMLLKHANKFVVITPYPTE